MNLTIRPAIDHDFDGIYEIFKGTVETGEIFIYDSNISRDETYKIWMINTSPYVAILDDKVVGIYLIRQNKVGRGSHVCNAAYMVHKDYHGQRIGEEMCKHSLVEAKEMGYLAMQFNIIVSTNDKAVSLWQKMGFEIVGTIPKAFDHATKGLVDAYIMHRFL